MQYVGGKSRIATEIVGCMRQRPITWEPFCGGLAVTAALVRAGANLVCTDACAPLIVTYRAIQSGWDPPEQVTEEEYAAARTLPDEDPLKAFIGFGCSFGAKWFGGYARSRNYNFARRARNSILPICRAGVQFGHLNFLDQVPCRADDLVIYADPPYANTQGYGATGAFDHDMFWRRCWEWACNGALVYVSEYSAPEWAKVIWSKKKNLQLAGGSQKDARLENLYQVSPC